MYLAHYHLSEKPFQINTDPRFLWLGEDHKEALANLKYGLLEGNGYMVLVGPVGTGKTTLVNALIESLDERIIVANINFPSLDSADFLSYVVRTFDPRAQTTTKADCLHALRRLLDQAREDGKVALLIIDEAHRLSEALLEDIRLLSNMQRDGETLINIFFVGQSELRERLLSPRCSALRQRITLFYHLKPLSDEETSQYILHRLHVAGCGTSPFTPEAVQAVFQHSRGYPRLINKLCDRAMLTGFVKERNTIDAAIVVECAREISLIDPMPTNDQLYHAPQSIPPDQPRQPRFHPIAITSDPAPDPKMKVKSALKRGGVKIAAFWQGTARGVAAGLTAACTAARRRTGKTVFAAAAAVLLLLSGALAVGIFNSRTEEFDPGLAEDAPRLSATSNPRTSEAAPGKPPSEGETAPGHLSHRTASAPDAGLPPGPPSIEVKVSAMLAEGDYRSVIRLMETENDPAAEKPSIDKTLYARALLGRAEQLKEQSPEEAERLLVKAVDLTPDNVDGLVALGNHYTRAQKYSQAIDAFQRAIELDPRRTDALFNLGYIYATIERYPAAEQVLSRVVALKPAYLDRALFNLAIVQQKMGKRQESLASLETAVAIQPDNRQARAWLEKIKAEHGSDTHEE